MTVSMKVAMIATPAQRLQSDGMMHTTQASRGAQRRHESLPWERGGRPPREASCPRKDCSGQDRGAMQGEIKRAQHKELAIVLPNAASGERAVMIMHWHAHRTDHAMVRLLRLKYLAFTA